MATFDREDLQLRLEAMKMNQGTMQQLMTLSAGGLALYFSFIGKAPFLESLRVLGVFVVLSWIVSLCPAVIAYWLHGKLFLSIYHVTALHRQIDEFASDYPEQIEEELKGAGNRDSVLARAKTKGNEERQNALNTTNAFEAVFFPTQKSTIMLMSISLFFFVLGFVWLGAGYVLWSVYP